MSQVLDVFGLLDFTMSHNLTSKWITSIKHPSSEFHGKSLADYPIIIT
jgi:hypothetical protein